MSRKKEKKQAREKASTRQLIGAEAVTDYSLVTHGQGELVYFIVKPSNISVLSEASVGARIYALMTVLKGVAEIEMLCLNSRESFEDNMSSRQKSLRSMRFRNQGDRGGLAIRQHSRWLP